jgi:tetratricopeptide (TPR) repeat protein
VAHEARIQQKQALFQQSRTKEDLGQLAEVLARAGAWAEAGEAFAKAVEQSPQNILLQYHHFLSVLRAGNQKAYRRLAADALARYGPGATEFSSLTAWACSLAPGIVADHDEPVRVAEAALERAAAKHSKPIALRCLGAALYRAGRYEEAIRRLAESGTSEGVLAVPQVGAFLAMAHHHKGNDAEARRWLDKLQSYKPSDPAGDFWDAVEIHLLRREAESVVAEGPPAQP